VKIPGHQRDRFTRSADRAVRPGHPRPRREGTSSRSGPGPEDPVRDGRPAGVHGHAEWPSVV